MKQRDEAQKETGRSVNSSALDSTFWPAFCTSLPAPATVLHALSVAVENAAIIIKTIKRFIDVSL